jgi:hypothetical protein
VDTILAHENVKRQLPHRGKSPRGAGAGKQPAPKARRLPSLNGLRAFEAAARHASFTAASEELNVTQAAVSRMVRLLEDRLGFPLFERRWPRRSCPASSAWPAA